MMDYFSDGSATHAPCNHLFTLPPYNYAHKWGETLKGHKLTLILKKKTLIMIFLELLFVFTDRHKLDSVKYLRCSHSASMKSSHACSSLRRAAITHCLAPTLFKHKSTWKADFLLLRGSSFLLSTEELGQNNNCWRIVPENTQRSFDLHVIFIRPLSKAPQRAHRVTRGTLSCVRRGKSLWLPGCDVWGTSVCESESKNIYHNCTPHTY